MPQPDLHIIAFAVPYPPTYGGAIDVWNRVRALHRQGVKVALHCFVYGPFGPHDALREVTREVYYYPRITWPAIMAPGTPYIVSSRKNPILLARLQKDEVPVLFEGIHTTGYAEEIGNRKKLLRAHNIEHHYYNELAKDSQRFRYLFFQRESLALQYYEMQRASIFDHVFCISGHDHQWYSKQKAKCDFLPVFHGHEEVKIEMGKGEYFLYQGDLSIESNQKAILELIEHGVHDISLPIVVAGKSGGRTFEEKLTKYPNLKREQNVSEGRMHELVCQAQGIIIHSRHSSGMKVKLFPALYHGRNILANNNSLTGTGIDKGLEVYTGFDELKTILQSVANKEFTSDDLIKRTAIVKELPSDDEKAKEIIRYL